MRIKPSQIHSEHVIAAESGWSAVYRTDAGDALALVPIVAWAVQRLIDADGNVFTKLSALSAFDQVREDVRFYQSPDGRFWDRDHVIPLNEKEILEALSANVEQDFGRDPSGSTVS